MNDTLTNWAWIKLKLRKDRKFFFEFILGHYAKTKDVGELHKKTKLWNKLQMEFVK